MRPALDCFDKLVGVFLVHFDIEYIDAGIDFEQQPFSFQMCIRDRYVPLPVVRNAVPACTI